MAGFPKAGDDYAGRYSVVRELGHGDSGIVYEAVDRVLNRSVAIKIVLPSLSDRGDQQARFAREAAVITTIRSRHVVGIEQHGEHDDTVYVVTELFPDGDLQSWLTAQGPARPSVSTGAGGAGVRGARRRPRHRRDPPRHHTRKRPAPEPARGSGPLPL